jgi:hypothetical protein
VESDKLKDLKKALIKNGYSNHTVEEITSGVALTDGALYLYPVYSPVSCNCLIFAIFLRMSSAFAVQTKG